MPTSIWQHVARSTAPKRDGPIVRFGSGAIETLTLFVMVKPSTDGRVPIMNVPPVDLLNAIDALKKRVDTETALRSAANDEWQSGERNGPMRAAHDQSLKNVVAAAQALMTVAQ